MLFVTTNIFDICNILERLLIGKLVNKTSWALNIKRMSPSACHSYIIYGTLGEWLRYSGVTICRQIYQYDLVGLKKSGVWPKDIRAGFPPHCPVAKGRTANQKEAS